MRYDQFILREGALPTKKIRTECSEILNIYNDVEGFIYRGVKTQKQAFRSEIKEREKTFAMPKTFHEFFHTLFKQKGLTATRKNSIFTSPDLGTASSWGTEYVVFPPNGFEFTWFENNKDEYPLFYLTDKVRDYLDRVDLEIFQSIGIDPYEDSRLPPQLAAKDTFVSDPQYMSELKKQHPRTFKELKDVGLKAIENLGPRTDNLGQAIKKRQEILITAPYYYGIDSVVVDDPSIRNRLGLFKE